MAEVRYQDRYAQVRQLNIHNRSVCYWRNNLSIGDFREEGEWYVYEDEGSYNGLFVRMRIAVKKEHIKCIFRRKEKSLVEFWGSPGHMGIRVRMKSDLFPRKCRGSTASLEYEFEMSGTIRGLSYVNENIQHKGRRTRKRNRTNKAERSHRFRKGIGNETESKRKAGSGAVLKPAFYDADLSGLCG